MVSIYISMVGLRADPKSFNISVYMKIRNQQGSALSVMLIIILVLSLFGALGFGLWANAGKQNYKVTSDAEIAAAVESAKQQQAGELQKQFDEQSKSPNKNYKSPVASGSVSFSYPKTWSAYVIEGKNNSQPINGYFHPNQVPGVDREVSYALRVEMLNTDYSQVVDQASRGTSQAPPKISAYIPPKMKEVANVQPGVRIDGAIDQEKSGSLIIMKVRDKTLKIYTESPDFIKDFNEIILPSLTFSP